MEPHIPPVRRSLAVLAFAGALAAAGAGVARSDVLPTLYVTYSMNCTFTITDDAGNPVTSIAPGDYDVEVTTPTEFALIGETGSATACNGEASFQLTGPGVSLSTTFENGDGDYEILNATFLPSSTYTAVDNYQPTIARVTFTTLASGSPPSPSLPPGSSAASTTTSSGGGSSSGLLGSTTTSTSSAPPQIVGTLAAKVSTAGKLGLTYKGKPVTTLTAGRYTITVVDSSTKSGFILQETDRSATTISTAGFVGKRSTTVDMTAGQWFYYPTFLGKKTYFLVIS